MKILLITIILFSSPPLFAGDNLTGSKIFCKKAIHAGKELVLVGFEFINKYEVIYYYHTNRRFSLYSSIILYEASTSQIQIKPPRGSTFTNIEIFITLKNVKSDGAVTSIFTNNPFYIIDRKDLIVEHLETNTLDFGKYYCKFIDESLEISFGEALL